MATQRLEAGISFDLGIDSTVHTDGAWALPASGALPPVGQAALAHLSVLFPASPIDEALFMAIRPQVDDPAVLTPNGFDSALRAALFHCEQACATFTQHDDAAFKHFHAGMRTLSNEMALRGIVHTYRNALLAA
jgi:hypothetical protein